MVKLLFTAILSLLLMGGFGAHAGDKMQKMAISHCSFNICVKVETDRGYLSPLDPQVTSFDSGSLEVFLVEKHGTMKSKQLFQFEEGYIDLESQILVTKGLKNSTHQDALIHLSTGKIDYYQK